MILRRIASAEKAKLLPTHGHLLRQDAPVIVTVSSKTLARATARVEIGGDRLFGQIPRAFNLVVLPRSIPIRVFRPIPAIQPPAS